MRLPTVASPEDLIRLVEELGFLPYFRNSIPGFSLEECIDRRYWFTEQEGAWEWKGPVIRASGCAYGKFFGGKAAFISHSWFADFANFRRVGYDMDALYDDGYARREDLDLWRALEENGPLLTGDLKIRGGFGKGGRPGFEGAVTRLQMGCYVVVSDFEYRKDKEGRPYGWGVARYATPEQCLGEEFCAAVYQRDPRASGERVEQQLLSFIPAEYAGAVRRLLRRGQAAPL